MSETFSPEKVVLHHLLHYLFLKRGDSDFIDYQITTLQAETITIEYYIITNHGHS